jgi:nicotinamidase-related amidase
LLVDFLNPLDFTADRAFVQRAVRAARATRRLKARMAGRGAPIIYANDHWGAWTRSLDSLVAALASSNVPGRALVELLAPGLDDYTILKPRHSAFYGTPLEFLLDELGVGSLTIAGIAADNCVLSTASDAYVRKFQVWVPSNCVAAEKEEHRLAALAHMKRVLKARTAAA